MRLAKIENGVVVNIAEADPENVPDFMEGWPSAPAGVGKGWLYDGETFSAPEAEPEPVPESVTRLQIKRQAQAMPGDVWASLKTWIEADPDRAEEWALAVEILSNDPLITDAQAALGWTDAERDDFLRGAATR